MDKVKHNANEEIQTSQTNTPSTIAGNKDKQSELAETVLAFEQKLALIKEFKNQVFSQIKPVKKENPSDPKLWRDNPILQTNTPFEATAEDSTKITTNHLPDQAQETQSAFQSPERDQL